jgi:hypothetical protein
LVEENNKIQHGQGMAYSYMNVWLLI